VFQLSNYNYNFKNVGNQLQLITITNYHYNFTGSYVLKNALLAAKGGTFAPPLPRHALFNVKSMYELLTNFCAETPSSLTVKTVCP